MAEQRKKTHSILLTTEGKNITVELFDACLWPHKTSDDGQFRVRIDGKWYTAAGKYTFLSYPAIGALLARLLAGQEVLEEEQPPVFKPRQRVSACFGECVGSIPLRREMGWVVAPPFRGVDGQWYVHVALFDGVKAIPVYDIEKR